MATHTVVSEIDRPDPALIARARDTYACIAGSVAGRRHVMDAGIRPLRRDWRIAGPAVTVAAEDPVDTLASQVATQLIQPGDIIVVEATGRADKAAWGATMAWAAKELGCAGVVVDGVVLTTELLIDHEGIPVFCRGSVTNHSSAHGAGSVNVPIVCGGIIVNPGDLILADEDGVVALPRALVASILDTAGQGRAEVYPPASRKKSYAERGFVEKLRGMDGVTWK
ncbi:MAG: RraA family protein [Proteobacteria bacterium]|nr:RraA family protein [Pseudomonadota bacterium]MDA1057583.1 RraA family protein [Pseudomonadota bacterium]